MRVHAVGENQDTDRSAGSGHVDPAPQPDAVVPWRRLLGTGAAVGLGCAAIALVNPTDSGVPICWSQSVLGVDCTLCGGLRCVNSLVRGDVGGAADHNVLLAAALPAIAVLWVVQVALAARGRALRVPSIPRWLWVGLGVIAVAFTVSRNLDADGFVGWLAATRG